MSDREEIVDGIIDRHATAIKDLENYVQRIDQMLSQQLPDWKQQHKQAGQAFTWLCACEAGNECSSNNRRSWAMKKCRCCGWIRPQLVGEILE